MKAYYQTTQSHPKAKRNTPLPKRSDTVDPKPATSSIHIANAPPLHQEVKRTPDSDIRRPQAPIVDEPARERAYHSDEIRRTADVPVYSELPRTDSTSLDLNLGMNYHPLRTQYSFSRVFLIFE